ncbi:hypothetical protein KZ810_02585 [Sphingomonas sp. RHCKR47]|nr:hypothetical protein [Sphingomonas citricola]
MTGSPLTPKALATWTHEEVAAEWRRSDWMPGDLTADALAMEMQRRGLDF